MGERATPGPLSRLQSVLVVYGRSWHATETYTSLAAGTASFPGELDLLVYDNSPTPQPPVAGAGPLRIEYRHDPSNPGVSRAYNVAAELARQRGKEWLLLLDQDTTFPPDALGVYARALAGQPEESMLAPVLCSGEVMVSPCRFVAGFGWPLKSTPPAHLVLRGHSILNSGMLVRLDAFLACGGFNESIPLDFADHDFCRRFAARAGMVQVLPVVCNHGFADRAETTLAKDLQRFAFFCRGARHAIPGMFAAGGYLLAMLLRCAVLCWRHQCFSFVPVVWREFCRQGGAS